MLNAEPPRVLRAKHYGSWSKRPATGENGDTKTATKKPSQSGDRWKRRKSKRRQTM